MAGDEFRRVILNANTGVDNVLDAKVIRKDLQAVMDKLFNILKGHYGPLSTFAAIDSGNVLDDTQFTKDGINIIRDIEFASPMEDWVRKTIAFIGSRVESSVGDGTTSAMMFTCAMLKHMLEHIDEIKPISYTQLYNTFLGLINQIEDRIDRSKVSPFKDGNNTNWDLDNIDTDIVSKIVYNQVYTSSHGDEELASALAAMYSKTPPELWDRMTYERLKYESDKRFEVVASEGQYTMHADVFTNSMLNQDFCTWFKSDNCKLMILNNAINIDTSAYDRIMEVIKEDLTCYYPLVILCHSNISTATYQELIAKIDEEALSDHKIAIFTVNTKTSTWNPSVNDFVALQLLCGVDITKMTRGGLSSDCIEVDSAKVMWKNDRLVLDNLYVVPEQYANNPRRHQCLDGHHSQFTDYVATVKKYADGYAKLDHTRDNVELQNLMYRMYAKLTYRNTYTMRIGGNAHDNLAMVDIVDDCIRAASRGLKNGIVHGNNRTLYFILKNYLRTNNLESWLVTRMLEAFDDIAISLLEQLYPKKRFTKRTKRDFADWWYSTAVDLLEYDYTEYWRTQCSNLRHIGECSPVPSVCTRNLHDNLERMLTHSDKGKNNIICQPANTDISMLKRFAEVAVKYVLTGRIIVRNAAYVDKNKGAGK